MKKKIEFIKQWFYSRKLKEKIRVLFLILIMTNITTMALVYQFFIRKSMLEYMLDSNYDTMVSIGNNLNVEFDIVGAMSQLIMTNSNVTDYLKDIEPGQIRVSHNAISAIDDIINKFNYVSSVYIFKPNNLNINKANEIPNLDIDIIKNPYWRKEIIEKAGAHVIRVNGDGAFERKNGDTIISFIRLINDLDTQLPIGMIVVNLNIDILEDSFRDITGDNRVFCYYDDTKNTMFKDEKFEGFEAFEAFRHANINEKKMDQTIKERFGDTKILSYYHVPNTPFVLYQIEKVSFWNYISTQAMAIIIIIIILSIVCLSILGIFISVYVAKPIDRLIQYMDASKLGLNSNDIRSMYSLNSKTTDLKKSNLIEINKIIDELLDREKATRKAELEVLREQMKPHFLYNTLSTIADLALQNSSDEIYDAVETLGNFYRRFLSKGSKVISIREEIAIVKDYLKLQKLRYQGVFEDEYELSEELMDIKIPILILQPLVENSLYHGVRLKGEKGLIKISVYSRDEKLHIAVYDTGVGMSPEKIEEIMSGDIKKSFGFKGTIARIQYYYDVEDVFEITSEEGIYCKVDIKIPLKGGIS